MALRCLSRRQREEVVMGLRRRFLTGPPLRRGDGQRIARLALTCLVMAGFALFGIRSALAEDPPINLKIVGGLGGVAGTGGGRVGPGRDARGVGGDFGHGGDLSV